MTKKTSLRPKEARQVTQDCLDLLAEVTAELAALQALVLRPGASGQVGSSVAVGVDAWKRQQVVALVKLVTFHSQLDAAIARGSTKLEKADEITGDDLRRIWESGTFGQDRA